MKRIVPIVPVIVAATIVAASFTYVVARTPVSVRKHRVVFEAIQGAEQWSTYMANIQNVRRAFGPENVEVELVVHGPALLMLQAANSELDGEVREAIEALAGLGVTFAACNNSMIHRKVTKEELFPFAVVVDAALAELTRKQEEGWAYIKLGW